MCLFATFSAAICMLESTPGVGYPWNPGPYMCGGVCASGGRELPGPSKLQSMPKACGGEKQDGAI